jgi:hypothetical protein
MPTTGTDCWIWPHGKSAAGYGRTEGIYVHRLAYEQWVGPIPEGMAIHHRCHTRACFNPEHLEAVTSKEHAWKHAKTEADTCPQGHPYTSENLKVRQNGKRECRICHRESQRERSRRRRAPAREAWETRNELIRGLATLGLKQSEIAAELNVSRATVSRVLSGALKTA